MALKILLCPDKYKGSLTAEEVCEALATGILRQLPSAEILQLPFADGGDGTLDVLKQYLSLQRIEADTLDPLGRPIKAHYLASENEAFIEVASASGLVLLSEEERNVMNTSSFGTGILVKDALQRGKSNIFLLLGGSATNDLGMGIAQALGVKFKGISGTQVTGGMLDQIQAINIPSMPSWAGAKFTLLCDVDNPLLGNYGAAQVYASQKGASEQDVLTLERAARRLTSLLQAFAKTPIGELKGGGAAGGIGAGMVALMQATLKSGFDVLASLTQLENKIKWADLVITGEGRLDAQSFQGKVVGKITEICTLHHKPCHLVVGHSTYNSDQALPANIQSVTTLTSIAPSIEIAINEGYRLLEEIGEHRLQV